VQAEASSALCVQERIEAGAERGRAEAAVAEHAHHPADVVDGRGGQAAGVLDCGAGAGELVGGHAKAEGGQVELKAENG
jgi:hypothetical protein